MAKYLSLEYILFLKFMSQVTENGPITLTQTMALTFIVHLWTQYSGNMKSIACIGDNVPIISPVIVSLGVADEVTFKWVLQVESPEVIHLTDEGVHMKRLIK